MMSLYNDNKLQYDCYLPGFLCPQKICCATHLLPAVGGHDKYMTSTVMKDI